MAAWPLSQALSCVEGGWEEVLAELGRSGAVAHAMTAAHPATHERRLPKVVARARIGSCLQQQPYAASLALLSAQVKRRAPEGVFARRGGAEFDQERNDARVASLSRPCQERLARGRHASIHEGGAANVEDE